MSLPSTVVSTSSSSSSSSFAAAQSADTLLVRDVDGQYRVASSEEVLLQAWGVLAARVKPGAAMTSPQAVKDYLRLQIGLLEYEVFCVVFLDVQNRVIELRQMFRGTVTQTSVYPREVVKESLQLNAAAVILAHSVARHKMCILCPVFLCAQRSEHWRRSRVSYPHQGT